MARNTVPLNFAERKNKQRDQWRLIHKQIILVLNLDSLLNDPLHIKLVIHQYPTVDDIVHGFTKGRHSFILHSKLAYKT